MAAWGQQLSSSDLSATRQQFCPGRPMSALGQKRTLDRRLLMSALPPKADIGGRERDVRFVPILLQKAAIMSSLAYLR
jgi:hypothetical protein